MQNPATYEPRPAPIVSSSQVSFPGTSKPKLWLDRRREGYDEDCAWWRFLRECDEGGRAWINGQNLPPHLLEVERNIAAGTIGTPSSGGSGGAGAPGMQTRSEYQIRLENTFRFNLVRDVIDAYLGFLSTGQPNREIPAGLERLKDFEAAADRGRSRDFNALIRLATKDALLLGVGHVLVDVELTDAVLAERLEGTEVDPAERMPAAVARGVRGKDSAPYAYKVEPEDVLDFILNPDGTYAQALIREWVNRSDDLEQASSGLKAVYRKWTATAWTLYEIDEGTDGNKRAVRQIDSGTHTLGAVPLVTLRIYETRSRARGRSQVEDLALTDRGLTDLVSSLAYGLGNASDMQVNVFADLGSLQGKPEGEKAAFEAAYYKAASSTVGLFNSQDKVQLLEKAFASASLMLQAFVDLYSLALRSAGLADKVDSTEQSGIARLRAAQPLNAALSAIGMELQRFERAVLRAAGKLLGAKPELLDKIAVSYPRNFDVLSIDALLLLRKELDGKAPQEILNWITEQILKKSFPDRSKATVEEHEKALKAFKPPPSLEEEMARIAAEGKRPDEQSDGGPPPGEPGPEAGERQPAPVAA